MPGIAENLRAVRERIAAAAARAGRDPEKIVLVAVSKKIPPALVNEAIRAGVTAIGENRVQEAEAKWPELLPGPERHLVGSLQRNKAGKAVELFDRIQSIDSVRLAEAVSRLAEKAEKTMPVLLEVNISGEASKAGAPPEDLRELAERSAALPGLLVEGLMTIGPLTDDEKEIRNAFRRTRALFDDLRARPVPGARMEILSMGMSGDLEIAVEEGATLVRVGTAIFGPRPPA